ncbi:hypothetical protein PENTCL1PPCAC_7212, partial [Pristionchus entomophagus]
RLFSSISLVELSQHPKAGTCLSIDLKNGGADANVKVPLVWFRDHCRNASPKCSISKRNRASLEGEAYCRYRCKTLIRDAVTYDGKQLSINWEDGHKSMFDSDLLIQMLVKPKQ